MQIADLIGSIRVGEPFVAEGLGVFPLEIPGDMEARYVLFDDLLDRRLAEVTEVSEGGSVPNLVVANNADTDALILDGTELHGAKQDRMVNITLIIAKHSRETIPVSCVESGRWAYKGRSFSSSKRTVASRLRWSKAASVHEHMAMGGTPTSDQRRVWDEIDAYQARAGSRSDTRALRDVFEKQARAIDDVTAMLKDIDAHGVVVALNGRILGMDLITHRQTFKKLWLGLLHGYAVDAVLEKENEPSRVEADTVRAWLDDAARTISLEAQKVPGSGQYFSCQGSRVAGGVVEHMGNPVHVMLFPDERTSRSGRQPAGR